MTIGVQDACCQAAAPKHRFPSSFLPCTHFSLHSVLTVTMISVSLPARYCRLFSARACLSARPCCFSSQASRRLGSEHHHVIVGACSSARARGRARGFPSAMAARSRAQAAAASCTSNLDSGRRRLHIEERTTSSTARSAARARTFSRTSQERLDRCRQGPAGRAGRGDRLGSVAASQRLGGEASGSRTSTGTRTRTGT